MSASGVREVPLRYARSSRRRKTVLNLDLNDTPPTDTRDQEGPSIRTMPVPPAAIDVEAIDDEVVESSATAFAAVSRLLHFFFLNIFVMHFTLLKFILFFLTLSCY